MHKILGLIIILLSLVLSSKIAFGTTIHKTSTENLSQKNSKYISKKSDSKKKTKKNDKKSVKKKNDASKQQTQDNKNQNNKELEIKSSELQKPFQADFNQRNVPFQEQYPELIKANYLLLMDQDTKEVLLEKNADTKVAPSSMTKLMTAYVIFDQLEKGTINLTNQCVIGKDAWKKSGSKMFLNYGDVVSIDQLITGLLVVSGNDASIALAEATSGSIENFTDLMNETAKRIGLKNSHFKNPHGLNQDGHYMTLRDLSIVASRIASDFPQYLHYFSETDFTYQNITQHNRNPLIKKGYEGATGMKTGHTDAGGFGMVGTATRGARRLIAITNDAKTPIQREKIITQLLDYGFNDYKKITFFDKNYPIATAKTWLGTKSEVSLFSNQDIAMTIPSNQTLDKLKVNVNYRGPIYAPIIKNENIATLTIEISGKEIKEIPLFSKENIDKAGYLARIYQITKYQFRQFIRVIKN
jgi:D-alanyl-D-alanine carboxypeptidase (penicillin-binding protein 5/6)